MDIEATAIVRSPVKGNLTFPEHQPAAMLKVMIMHTDACFSAF